MRLRTSTLKALSQWPAMGRYLYRQAQVASMLSAIATAPRFGTLRLRRTALLRTIAATSMSSLPMARSTTQFVYRRCRRLCEHGTGSTNPLPPLVLSDRVIFAAGNVLYAVSKSTLQTIWQYNAGARIDTPASYSSRNLVVIVTQDLYVHALSNASGTLLWRTKPTPRIGGTVGPNDDATHAEVAEGYPAIADVHGIVFVRYKIDWGSIYANGEWQPDNTWIRNTLTADPCDRMCSRFL